MNSQTLYLIKYKGEYTQGFTSKAMADDYQKNSKLQGTIDVTSTNLVLRENETELSTTKNPEGIFQINVVYIVYSHGTGLPEGAFLTKEAAQEYTKSSDDTWFTELVVSVPYSKN